MMDQSELKTTTHALKHLGARISILTSVDFCDLCYMEHIWTWKRTYDSIQDCTFLTTMAMALKKLFFLSLLILIHINGHRSCPQVERLALLDFKSFLKSGEYDADHLLPSWAEDAPECCDWERVTCDPATGHVIRLSLNNLREYDYDSLSSDDNIWFLNISLFYPLKELKVLNLSYNTIGGWNDNEEGTENMSRLNKLETLDLHFNKFNRSIVSSLRGLTSLKNLVLSLNELEGSFPAKELSNFKHLEMLDLSYNSLDATLDQQGSACLSKLSKVRYLDLSANFMEKKMLKFLGELSSLRYLDLSYNLLEGPLSNHEMSNFSNLEILILEGNLLNGTLPMEGLSTLTRIELLSLAVNEFSGSIPPSIGELSSLRALSLFRTKLTGSMSIQRLCVLKRLEELDSSENNFEGILPTCLTNLTSLRLLDLSNTKLKGEIPPFLVAGLTSLEYIDLSHNRFEGLFSFSSFSNHSNLEVVRFISDNDKFEIEIDEDPGWVPPFQLKVFVLSRCNLNKVTNRLPNFLLHQRQLKVVDLSHNNLTGTFPGWLLENNTGLVFLNLRNNSFTGEFYIPAFPMTAATGIDISDNHITGELPENVGRLLPELHVLNLSRNSFRGNLPSSVGDLENLERLDLSSNKFFGEVPTRQVAGCYNLQFLKLCDNNFHGKFFSIHYNLSSLRILRLNGNNFTGSLSKENFNPSSALSLLDISNNNFQGRIPSWIGNMTSLAVLDMHNNSFEGKVDCGPFSAIYISYVDLSDNFLSGTLPSCSNMESLQQIHLQQNSLFGPLPKAFLNLSSLLVLNLKDNNLSGRIPDTISALFRLKVLLLRGNHFTGLIPKELCQLKNISLMDLSSNSFSGSIPPCFGNVTFGKMEHDHISFSEESISLQSQIVVYKAHKNLLKKQLEIDGSNDRSVLRVEVEFVTKNRPSSYKGDILNLMSGLDLSCNYLTGDIPLELGNMSWIRALNLSHNHLTGPIPRTFANLAQVESLDLSNNNLSGEIPLGLTDLYFLAVFSVAHNNLSGRTPEMKNQFGTFDNSSYEGNPFLCGPPLGKACSRDDHTVPSSPMVPPPHEGNGKWHEIDPVVFFASFSVSFLVFFIGVMVLLYVNPYWRRRLFYHAEEFMYSCYYFVIDHTLHKLSSIRLYH